MHELLERARAWSVELWARVFLIVALVVTSLYGLSCVPAKFWHDLVWCLWALIVGSVCFGTPYLITCLPFWPIWSWVTKVQYLCVSFFASLWLFLAQPVGYDLVELTFRALFPEKAWFFKSVNALLGAANSVSTSIATLVLSEAFHVSRWKMRALVPTGTHSCLEPTSFRFSCHRVWTAVTRLALVFGRCSRLWRLAAPLPVHARRHCLRPLEDGAPPRRGKSRTHCSTASGIESRGERGGAGEADAVLGLDGLRSGSRRRRGESHQE